MVKLGDGARTSFWYARWAGNESLRHRFPALFQEATPKHLTVKGWWSRYKHKRNMGVHLNSQAKIIEFSTLSALVSTMILYPFSDCLRWCWSSNGAFSVREAYRFLAFDGVNDSKLAYLWEVRAPIKIKIFMWLGARNRIQTADLLRKRGWIGPAMCVLCRRNAEWVEHLFFECSYARDFWRGLLRDDDSMFEALVAQPGTLAERLNRIMVRYKGTKRTLLALGIVAGCWELWRERNDRIFNDRRFRSSADCGSRTDDTIGQWLAALGHPPGSSNGSLP